MKKPAIVILLLVSMTCAAQQPAWLDTLDAAVKTDSRRIEQSLGHLQTGIEGIRAIVSPVGEGDPIRWAQSLPGVTTGADGTTAMYVRGGGAGNNLFSLDGVPVYGYSHILGLTTLVPTDVIESAELSKGGFDGYESNFTASHLKVVTKQPSQSRSWSAGLNNFLLSAGAEGPVGNRIGYEFSARVSPLALEYRALKDLLPGRLGGLNNFGASVGDIYGKINVRISDISYVSASALASQDHYRFDMSNASHEAMGWNNVLGILQYHRNGENTRLDVTAAYNKYGSVQQQGKRYRGRWNELSMSSGLTEYSFHAMAHHFWGNLFELDEGLTFRYAQFSPGQVGERSKRTDVILATPWVQASYNVPDKISLKAVLRGNYYHNQSYLPSTKEVLGSGGRTDPEVSLAAKWTITPHIAFEATFDRLVQYYHTLEGMPVGWSLDLIVPTVENILPEKSLQGGAGLSSRFGDHSLSVGGFYKLMNNLVYYKYSQELFSGGLAGWAEHVELGDGRSYGLETLYEFQHQDWYARTSYTLSKTTRENFPSFYEGAPFHARFDRRHMLNATLQWKGFSATMILQSGHWENGEAVTYNTYYNNNSFTSKYYSGVNNYHMPTVFRLDLGWQKTFNIGRSENTVNLGVCNVTNHFNPFMLYFDTNTESWKEIALLPIMPNFSWRVTF
ncbi:MAG: TonB-dependent receptor plug domain-containing protein [Bacteroidales bacterium]|nr:TonB-dependent receptor plug domain-containing protein [Bacteroidales bacterium]